MGRNETKWNGTKEILVRRRANVERKGKQQHANPVNGMPFRQMSEGNFSALCLRRANTVCCVHDERRLACSLTHSCGSSLLQNMLFRLNNVFFSHSCGVRHHDNALYSHFLPYNYFHFNDKLPMNNGEHVNGFN